MKRAFFAFIWFVAGALAASALAWGGLYLHGRFILGGQGSRFDENPELGEMFFFAWIVTALVAGALCAVWRVRRTP